ncbi:MAG: asparagine synthase (glutamine-hydrolyzing) [Bacteroidota bacterium]|nr:asparagine synthase (glutamine-hydrolyzing) [Bacteroidota bacterium]
MCGIAGILQRNGTELDPSLIGRMTSCMSHRGPDADGCLNEGGLALGHRRLSIIDLSSAANQPFTDNSGRYVMVFNGEIYNFQAVKRLIGDYDFKTNGDTEVLIAAYAKWGPDFVTHMRGMFALAIWDRQEKELFLVRDRMGVKPLYYYLDENLLVFASELRAILSTGLVKKQLDSAALLDYFSYQSFSYPNTAIRDVRQVEAGSWMKIKQGVVTEQRYWNLTAIRPNEDLAEPARVHRRIRELLLQSVERRLVSDVPVGAFLSGGIDSAAVVGLMAEAGGRPPDTYNICFEEKEYDESRYAEMVAAKFNARHHRILLKPSVFLDELVNALDAMDTPSGDGNNTYTVSRAIRQNGITVALSGVGGDELFAGYPFFEQYLRLREKSWIWKIPAGIRGLVGRTLAFGVGGKKGRMGQILNTPTCSIEHLYPIFRQILSPATIGKLTSLPGRSSGSRGGNGLIPGAGHGGFVTAVQRELTARKNELAALPLLSQVSAAEYLGYTQHTLLKDTDQMSMAVSLEVREHFFDQDLLEYVLAVPDRLKRPVYPKSLMVESLKPMLPDEIVFRKKQGFLFPWNVWIRNELRSFCEGHIRSMAQRPFIEGERLMDHWRRFLSGDATIRWPEIWLFVVLDYWLQKNHVE